MAVYDSDFFSSKSNLHIGCTPFDLDSYRLNGAITFLDRMDVPSAYTLIDFLKENKDSIEDVFVGYDEIFILPKTIKFANKLQHFVYDDVDESFTVSDDCGWEIDDDGRYWLWLWWD